MEFDKHKKGFFVVGGFAVAALGMVALAPKVPDFSGWTSTGAAWAQTHTGGSGGHDDKTGGHDDGHEDDSGDDGKKGGHSGGQGGHQGDGGAGTGGQGQGGGKGAGQGGSAGAGGSPIWAREGIPEVELGRLNVSRSPDQVLARAFDEALASLSPEMAAFYSMDLDDMILELSTNFDNVSYIDSPLQNLALFKDALDGTSVLTSTGEITNTNNTLLATFLGVASDKNLPISSDTVKAVSTILGAPLSDAAAASLAADAEAVRIAVLAGHG